MWGTCEECMGNMRGTYGKYQGNMWEIYGKYFGNKWGFCGEHMENMDMTNVMIVQGESYYKTLVMCNYAVAWKK